MMLPKPSIRSLKPYTTEALTYKIKLDANEATRPVLSDFKGMPEDLYLYPDNYATELRKKAANYYGVSLDQIIAGNGSSEMLELILKTYIDYQDVVLGFEPSFSMYRVFSEIYSANYVGINNGYPFEFNADIMIEKANDVSPKVIFLCTPNNPTGKTISEDDIKKVIDNTDALVVVDEAYIEFYDTEYSMLKYLEDYPRLIVLRTVSKALGLAGIRLGFLCANQAIVETLNKVKAPYNLNTLTQTFGLYAFDKIESATPYLKTVKAEREKVYSALRISKVDVFTSEANFLFFRSERPNLFELLLEKGVLIRAFSGFLEGYYRVSIGTEEENSAFIKAMKEVIDNA